VRIANSLISPSILDQINVTPEFSIMETVPPKDFIGKSIREMDVRAKYGLNIIAVKKKEPTAEGSCEMNVAPKADYIVKEDDVFVIIGSDKNLDKFKKKHRIEK
ncbi:MAG: TrkA C-terminal domain-containing protein, partial [Candidatus Omnitrophota bacterium]|nr:TrkA C-terminal domain-containing protein [Candidatus Omnitrophota bacterium]